MNIVIIGLPGSGKGTQADILAQKLGLFHFSAGELARELAQTDSRIKALVQSGALIPDEEMTGYVSAYLEKNVPSGKNILFEGYPRFVKQYKYLINWLKEREQKIQKIIFLEVEKEEVIKRLSTRRTCRQCEKVYNLVTNPPPKTGNCECGGELFQRNDDTAAAIEKRFAVFKQNVQPLIDYLQLQGRLTRVDGSRSIPVVTKAILEIIRQDD